MDEKVQFVAIEQGSSTRDIAFIQRDGQNPGLFWLGGFRSDMLGSKARFLDSFAAEHNLALTRMDYSGHGQSTGAFGEGTITRWLDEAIAIFAKTSGEQIIIGSSMGGWLALLLNKHLRENGIDRVKAIVLIAPAVDMTHDLMLAEFTAAEHAQLTDHGYVAQPSQYSDEPYVITKSLLDDGAAHLLFTSLLRTHCAVTILQGGKDIDVPPSHALKLVAHLIADPVTFTLIPDGDHRLSTPSDLDMLGKALSAYLAE